MNSPLTSAARPAKPAESTPAREASPVWGIAEPATEVLRAVACVTFAPPEVEEPEGAGTGTSSGTMTALLAMSALSSEVIVSPERR